jgi:hypothetical protein
MPNFARDDVYKRPDPKPAPKPEPKPEKKAPAPVARPAGLYPPTTPGPANSPQGVLRSHVAADQWMSDDARRLLSQTPVHWNPQNDNPEAGQYAGPEKGIDLKTWGRAPEEPSTQDTLAHEFAHAWQDQKTPNFHDPNYPDQFLSDVHYYADKDPYFNQPVAGWYDNAKQKYADNPYIDTQELGARIFAGVPPHRLPPDFRNQYYPGMYRADTPYAGPNYPAPPVFVPPSFDEFPQG